MKSSFKPLLLSAALLFGPGTLLAEPVNINTADEEALAEALTGIGPALAAEIVRDRSENGPYESPEALMRVRGIGERVIENNRGDILVADPEPESADEAGATPSTDAEE